MLDRSIPHILTSRRLVQTPASRHGADGIFDPFHPPNTTPSVVGERDAAEYALLLHLTELGDTISAQMCRYLSAPYAVGAPRTRLPGDSGGRMETKTKLLDQMQHVLRLKHMSIRTEVAYLSWTKRFILFHG